MTVDIPKESWVKFFADVSKDNFHSKTSVELVNANVGSQILARDLPLAGLVAEEATGRKNKIEIMVGEGDGSHLIHNVENAERVALMQYDAHLGSSIAIESADGSITLVHLQKPLQIVAH
jgi:type II secretory pathway component PulJ